MRLFSRWSVATFLASALMSVVSEDTEITTDMNETRVLLDFDGSRGEDWEIVNDGVMGGRSEGFVQVEDGTLRFHGNLVTRGGGFTSVRKAGDHDLAGYDGLELRVRGNGRTFEVEVNDGQRYGWRSVSRRAPFPTTGEWRTVRVPFSSLRATVFGRPVDVPSVRLSEVGRIGFYIVDGKDGPFELEVHSVGAYRSR